MNTTKHKITRRRALQAVVATGIGSALAPHLAAAPAEDNGNQSLPGAGSKENPSDFFTFKRKIPIIKHYDLVVCGGGPSGVAAAIAAGRLGLKVLLVEALGCLGGTTTSGMVCYWMKLSDGKNLLAQGVFLDVLNALYENDALYGWSGKMSHPSTWHSKFDMSTTVNPEALKIILDDFCLKSGVDVFFHSKVIAAEVDEGDKLVKGVVIQHVEGCSYVAAKCYVDATGNGTLAHYCGVEYRQAGRDTEGIMPPTLCAMVADIDWSKMGGKQEKLEQAIKDGFFTTPNQTLPGVIRTGDNCGMMNAGHVFAMDALDVTSLSQGYVQGRKLVREYTRFYQQYMEGAKNMKMLATAQLMGIREARNIIGEYELTYHDMMNLTEFPDQVGLHCYYSDIHPYSPTGKAYVPTAKEVARGTPKKDSFERGDHFGLPYGMLVPKGWKNLWAPGRCASADVRAQGSIRVQQSCYIMGQAAGTAACQSIITGQAANELDTEQLVKTLRDNGQFLPQADLSRTMTRS